jgi:hypothetical protein
VKSKYLLIPVCLSALYANDPAAVFSFVKKNCVACHNASNSSGDVNLAAHDTAHSFDEYRETWERVVSKMRTGEMPPPPMKKPPAEEIASVTKYLESEFARQDRTARPDPGRVTSRRLNRVEYNNTVRDLLGVDIRPADDFPNDEAAFGFDNISDALTLSPVLLEKYLYAAERVVRTAIFGPEKRKPAAVHYSAPVRLNDLVTNPTLPKDLFHYDESGLSTRHAMHVLHRFPVDGEYNFRVVLNGHRPNGSEPATPAFWIDGKLIKEWAVDATDLEGPDRRGAGEGDGGRASAVGVLCAELPRAAAEVQRAGAIDAAERADDHGAREADGEGHRSTAKVRHEDQDGPD